MREPSSTSTLATGPGRLLVAVYAVFALAATGRSAVQLGTEAGRAPLAYSLSLLAAVLYLVATTCLLRGGTTARRVALVAVTVEAAGVLVVGTLSYVRDRAVPRQDRVVALRPGLRLPAARAAVPGPVVAAHRGAPRSRGRGLGHPSLNGRFH